MPRAFNKCVKSGGRVRTVKPSSGTHKPICYKGGKSYAGHTKRTKGKR